VHTGFWWGKLRERDNLEDPDLDRGIILRWIFKKWDGGMDWIDLAQNRYSGGQLWCANEPSVFIIKFGKFLD
jgi:hypothetical protein